VSSLDNSYEAAQGDAPVQERTGEAFQMDGVMVVSAVHAVHDTFQAFLAPSLPILIERLALTTGQAGLLSVFAQIPSLLQPLIGRLADRYNLRFILILSPAITASVMSFLAVTPTYGLMAGMLLLCGLSAAGLHAIGPVVTARMSGRHLGRGMSLWMVGGELGRTLGPLVVVTVVSAFGAGRLPWLIPLGLLASVLLAMRFGSLPGGTSQGKAALRAPGLTRLLPYFIPITGIVFFRAFMDAALFVYLPTFLRQEGAQLWLAGASLSIMQAAGILGALTGGPASDRYGRKAVLALAVLASPLLMLGFMALQGPAQFASLILVGFVTLSISPVLLAVVQESAPESQALANGLYMALHFSVRSIVTYTVGLLADFTDLRFAFTLSALVGLGAVVFVLLLPKKRHNQSTGIPQSVSEE